VRDAARGSVRLAPRIGTAPGRLAVARLGCTADCCQSPRPDRRPPCCRSPVGRASRSSGRLAPRDAAIALGQIGDAGASPNLETALEDLRCGRSRCGGRGVSRRSGGRAHEDPGPVQRLARHDAPTPTWLRGESASRYLAGWPPRMTSWTASASTPATDASPTRARRSGERAPAGPA